MNNIQRYTLRNRNIGDYFGEHDKVMIADFSWFLGAENRRLGIGESYCTEMGVFLGGFIDANDELIFDSSERYKRIYRNDFRQGQKIGIIGRTEQ